MLHCCHSGQFVKIVKLFWLDNDAEHHNTFMYTDILST